MKRQHSKKFAIPLLLNFLILPALLESSIAVSPQDAECDHLDGECERAYEEAAANGWHHAECTVALSKCGSCKQSCAVSNLNEVGSYYDHCSGKLRKLQKNCPA
jgi:hypothetical protein